ncbi:MAG: glycoside hydrolase family 3 protein [Spirochaetaceae bacterium]|nr:glycoside hydrolase family 3 protein [Spirochaetaceae bacterium]
MNLRGYLINKVKLIIISVILVAAVTTGFTLHSENLNRKKPDLSLENHLSENYQPENHHVVFDDSAKPESRFYFARRVAEQMNLSQLAGQVMMIGYAGSVPPPEIFEWIRDRNLGGIKIFGWNTDDLSVLKRSIEDMQEAALTSGLRIPLFIATDQEGGWIRHVRGNTSITPGNMALGASQVIHDSYMSGYFIGKELKALGINMNFAPTIDLLINPNAHVIGSRAFSDDPLRTAILGTAFTNGMRNAGVICTAKHFPGHGRTAIDSHGRLPIIDGISLDELFLTDLLPYDFLIRENIPAIMSGHLAFPDVTGNRRPASLSSFFLKDVLRGKMGFNGLIITDDMQMIGALYKNNVSASSLEALRAGNDVVLISRNLIEYDRIRNLIIREMSIDPDFERQIRKSVERILIIKYEYLDMETSHIRARRQNIYPVPAEGAAQFFYQQAFRSVSLLRSDKPLTKPGENERILLAGPFRLFLEEGVKRFPNAHTHFFPYSPFFRAREIDLRVMPEIVSRYDTVIFCTANDAGIEILRTLENSRARIIVLSTRSPANLLGLEWITEGVAVYGTGRESFAAGFAAIAGDFIPEGILPLATRESN